MGDKSRGLYGKFIVRRQDGSSEPGGKHDECDYFVLDLTHDAHAKAAILAYANSCETEYPPLAADLRAKYPAPHPDTQPGEVVVPRSMLVRWREIEHFAWHILDDSEERADTKELVIDQEISGTDLNALIELLPEGHPQSLDDQLKAAPSGRAT